MMRTEQRKGVGEGRYGMPRLATGQNSYTSLRWERMASEEEANMYVPSVRETAQSGLQAFDCCRGSLRSRDEGTAVLAARLLRQGFSSVELVVAVGPP